MFPGAGGGVLKDGPAAGEQGEPAFSLEAEAAQQAVAGTVADGELLVSAGVLHGDVDSGSGALVAAVGQGGSPAPAGQQPGPRLHTSLQGDGLVPGLPAASRGPQTLPAAP